MLIRREAVTRCGSVFGEVVIPPPCPPCSVLRLKLWVESPTLLCPLLTAAPGSARLAPTLSQFPWSAPSQDATQLSPDKNVSGRCTSVAFTLSPGSPDFGVLCHLVLGKRAFYALRVPRLAVRSPASFRPHLTVTPLPWTRSCPPVSSWS